MFDRKAVLSEVLLVLNCHNHNEETIMTTLVLRNPYALKIASFADNMLGGHSLKTGRSWYKGHQLCDMVVIRQDNGITIHSSGGIRFKLHLQVLDDGEMKGRITLLGWLRETSNALRIIADIVEHHAKTVGRRRSDRLRVMENCAQDGTELPEMTEAIGTHFSIKADEEKLQECERIDSYRSDLNFELALRSHWYHRDFVTFCKKHGIKCYFREIYQGYPGFTEAKNQAYMI